MARPKDYIYGRKEKQRLVAVHKSNLNIAAAATESMTYIYMPACTRPPKVQGPVAVAVLVPARCKVKYSGLWDLGSGMCVQVQNFANVTFSSLFIGRLSFFPNVFFSCNYSIPRDTIHDTILNTYYSLLSTLRPLHDTVPCYSIPRDTIRYYYIYILYIVVLRTPASLILIGHTPVPYHVCMYHIFMYDV
jgi:hypothetical protein